MKMTPLIILAILLSCNKNRDVSHDIRVKHSDKKLEACRFGISAFNQVRRPAEQYPFLKERVPRTGKPFQAPYATILLDFNGEDVSRTVWNDSGTIAASPANLHMNEVEKIIARVTEDFSPFEVVVTTDEAIYFATNPTRRMRVIITESWEWFGLSGGAAYHQSFTWGNDTPCFIFSTLLEYNEKFIAEAISHELGHTLGLYHQAVYDASCNFVSEFNSGGGSGVTGWAPIMGLGYFKNITTWHKGPTVFGCKSIQDDVAVISSILGKKEDDNIEMDRSEKVRVFEEGLITDSSDIDYYYVDIKDRGIVTVEPFHIENGEGANLTLKMHVYDKSGRLIRTVLNPSGLAVSTVLDRDKYFIGVETVAPEEYMRYGMLGRYVVREEE